MSLGPAREKLGTYTEYVVTVSGPSETAFGPLTCRITASVASI